MSLIYHFQIASPATLTADSPEVTKTKVNDNHSLWNTELTTVSNGLEDSFSTLFGEGLTSTPTVTTSTSSLSVTVGTFKSLIGREISYAGGNFTALASQASGSVYFCQDSSWSLTLPTTKSYFKFADYVSTLTGVTSLTVSNGILVPKILGSISDTIEDINIPETAAYADYEIDHSALGTIAIPGFITLTTSPSADFSAYLIHTSESEADTAIAAGHTFPIDLAPDGTTFWVRILRNSGYYYADNPACNLTYVRTGLALGN